MIRLLKEAVTYSVNLYFFLKSLPKLLRAAKNVAKAAWRQMMYQVKSAYFAKNCQNLR